MKSKRIKIGEVGVDSGQLLVCDPCYIKSEWKTTEDFCGYDTLRDTKTGKLWSYGKVKGATQFPGNYGEPIPECDNLTPNELAESGRWVVVSKPPPSGEFSYNGCCEATLSNESAGQLRFKLGHAGAGVAFSSGYGDGCYPVYATYNKEGRIVKVEIIMS